MTLADYILPRRRWALHVEYNAAPVPCSAVVIEDCALTDERLYETPEDPCVDLEPDPRDLCDRDRRIYD